MARALRQTITAGALAVGLLGGAAGTAEAAAPDAIATSSTTTTSGVEVAGPASASADCYENYEDGYNYYFLCPGSGFEYQAFVYCPERGWEKSRWLPAGQSGIMRCRGINPYKFFYR